MFGEQRMWLRPHVAPVSTLISIMIGRREFVFGPSTQRAQRTVSLDEGKWTSNYKSWHWALGKTGHTQSRNSVSFSLQSKKSPQSVWNGPKGFYLMCLLKCFRARSDKPSVTEDKFLQHQPMFSRQIRFFYALPRIITEACNIHATCDMGQRFQRTLAHSSMSEAGRGDSSHAKLRLSRSARMLGSI